VPLAGYFLGIFFMKTKVGFISALIVAFSASAAAPAFASGYGPAPSYRPSVGAPASQRGQNVQTVAGERANAVGVQGGYGGVVAEGTEAGGRVVKTSGDGLFAHH
jgi:hypothetical protein